MPIHYPPELPDDAFIDAPVVDSAARQRRLLRERRTRRAQRSASDEVARNRISRRYVGVQELRLDVGGRQSASFSPTRARADNQNSWTQTHPTVASGGPERINFLPGDPSNPALGTGGELCTIRYQLRSPTRVRRAWLELFRRDDENPLMRVELRWSAADSRLEPVDPAGAVRLQGPDLVWDGRLPAVDARVGGQVIDVGSSPYKLKLSVEPNKGVELDLGEAWTYFDVLVDSITLEWGDPTVIETARADVDARFQADVHGYELALIQDLGANAVDAQGNIDANDHALDLDSNLFCTDLTAQGQTDTPFRAYRDMWADGPQVPVFAKLVLARSDGATVAATAAPWALGKAELLWDWEDDPATKVAQWAGATPQRTQDYLDNALDYLVDIEASSGDAPQGSNNCHVHHGGKRGRGAAAVFPDQDAANYDGATAALIAEEFPFEVRPCAERRWAATSSSRTAGVAAGKSGAMFRPSRIAGDRYRVVAYLHTPEFPHAETGANLRASPIPHASTGVLEIRRRIKGRIYRADATVGNVNVAAIQNIFAEARVTFDLPAPATVNPGTWQQAFYDGLVEYMPYQNKLWFGALVAADQAGSDCVQFGDFNNLPGHAQALAASGLWEVTVSSVVGLNDYNLRPGEVLVHAGTNTRALVIHREAAVGGNYKIYVEHALGQHLAPGQAVDIARGPMTLTVVASQRMNTPVTQAQVEATLTTLFTPSADNIVPERVGCSQIAKSISIRVMKAYTALAHPNEKAVYMFLYKQMGSHVGEGRAGGTNSQQSAETRSYAYLQDDPAHAAGPALKAFDLVAAHELGHALCLPHAPYADSPGHRVHIEVDDNEHDNCVMNYHTSSGHFCGMCMLRIMGWSMFGEAEAANADPQLVAMSNKDTGNDRDFQMQTLTASIPVTPPRTVRPLHNSTNLNVPPRPTANGAGTTDLAANAPLVLLTDSANDRAALADAHREAVRKPLRLVATARMPAGAQFVWKVERAPDDHVDVIAVSQRPVPGAQISGANNEIAEIETNATGTFHVKVSVNVGGGPAFDDAAEFLCINLVLVKVERLESKHNFTKHPGGCRLSHGDIKVTSHSTRPADPAAVRLRTKLRLIGGGADGRRGLDQVFGGWINNVRSDDTGADYVATDGTGATAKAQTLALHRDAGGAAASRMVPYPGNANPVVDKHTVAASVTNWVARMAVLSHANPAANVDLSQNLSVQTIGGHCWIANEDGPEQGWDVHPPQHPELEIRRIWLHTHFTAYLCLWTSSAPALLGVAEELPWQMDADYDVDGAGPRRARAKVRISTLAKVKHPSLVSALDTGIEWCPPSSLGDYKPRYFPVTEDPATDLGFDWANPAVR